MTTTKAQLKDLARVSFTSLMNFVKRHDKFLTVHSDFQRQKVCQRSSHKIVEGLNGHPPSYPSHAPPLALSPRKVEPYTLLTSALRLASQQFYLFKVVLKYSTNSPS